MACRVPSTVYHVWELFMKPWNLNQQIYIISPKPEFLKKKKSRKNHGSFRLFQLSQTVKIINLRTEISFLSFYK